jgi:hypothetical protein
VGTEIIHLGQGHYLIQSRTNPAWHYCVEDGVCTCRAAECFVDCWHLAEIRNYERQRCLATTGSQSPSS